MAVVLLSLDNPAVLMIRVGVLTPRDPSTLDSGLVSPPKYLRGN
jgi:hypothetical protein